MCHITGTECFFLPKTLVCFLLHHWSWWLFLPIHRISAAIINMFLSVPGKQFPCGGLNSQGDRKIRQYPQNTHFMKYLYWRKLLKTSIKKSFKEFQVQHKHTKTKSLSASNIKTIFANKLMEGNSVRHGGEWHIS